MVTTSNLALTAQARSRARCFLESVVNPERIQPRGKRVRATGMILYEGPSLLDGKPIVVIATFRSRNRKTGARVIQTWIIRADKDPRDVVAEERAFSICGSCPLVGTACYVLVHNAPLSVWNKYMRGGYSYGTLPEGMLRMGSYGDPGAVPLEIWTSALEGRDGVGYTHQYLMPHMQAYRGILMASTDTMAQSIVALSMGWRVFAVGHIPPGAVQCLADAKGLTCAQCRICNGNRWRLYQIGSRGIPEVPMFLDSEPRKDKASVWIAPHGAKKAAHPSAAPKIAGKRHLQMVA